MEKPPTHLILVAGEASGDMHGAHLARSLKRKMPSAALSGLGGPEMRAAGVTLYQDLTQLAVVGFWEVMKHYPEIKKAFRLILKKIDEASPDAVILIDYPGFNLRLAKELKKRGIKVIYYISPQVWAWKKNRVYFIRNFIDKMLVLFQFEADFYAQYGVDVAFVGHPLVDHTKPSLSKEQLLRFLGLKTDRMTVGILPGSRHNEIVKLLPVMKSAAEILARKFPEIQFLILKAVTIPETLLKEHLGSFSPLHRIVGHDTYSGINACEVCLVASGTATLETAILQKPMVIVYKTSLLTWLIAKVFIKIKHIGLVNVVAGKSVVPECIQFQATGKRIAAEMENIITNETRIAEIKSGLRQVRLALGSGHASDRAADEIFRSLHL